MLSSGLYANDAKAEALRRDRQAAIEKIKQKRDNERLERE
jgi:hypothetical protein